MVLEKGGNTITIDGVQSVKKRERKRKRIFQTSNQQIPLLPPEKKRRERE